MNRRIIGVLLAAGQSTRFDGNKLLHPMEDGTPIAAAAARRLSAVVPETLAVVDDLKGEVAKLLEQEGLQLVENPRAVDGMGGSIASGVAASRHAQGWVIALADMPYLPAVAIQGVVNGLVNGSDLIAPVFRQRRGHPVGFSDRFAGALLQLQGDEGARSIINANSDTLDLFEVHDEGVVLDIDCSDDVRTTGCRLHP